MVERTGRARGEGSIPSLCICRCASGDRMRFISSTCWVRLPDLLLSLDESQELTGNLAEFTTFGTRLDR